MPDFAAARINMVENQVRCNGVTDAGVIAAMNRVPREVFVPEAARGIAYMDEEVQVSRGRYLLQPRVFAKLCQAAEVTAVDRVLDVGCATGYSSAVLAALATVPRHGFVDAALATQAYEDAALPIGHGQTISKPSVVGRMIELLLAGGRPLEKVLEIGTGCGYQAAVLSRLAREVITVERYRTLADAARTRLQTLGMNNVVVLVGDGLGGVPDHAPYDRIIVTAAAETIPQVLVDELAEGGVMLLPLGPHSGTQDLVKLTKGQGGVTRENLIAVRFVPLLPGKAREL